MVWAICRPTPGVLGFDAAELAPHCLGDHGSLIAQGFSSGSPDKEFKTTALGRVGREIFTFRVFYTCEMTFFLYPHFQSNHWKIPTVLAKMEEKRLEYPMVTFLGNPVSFTGKQLQVGDKALDFSLTTTDLSKKSLADFDGKKKVLSVVPSIDTGICSTQTRRFNQELAGLDNTVVLTVSTSA